MYNIMNGSLVSDLKKHCAEFLLGFMSHCVVHQLGAALRRRNQELRAGPAWPSMAQQTGPMVFGDASAAHPWGHTLQHRRCGGCQVERIDPSVLQRKHWRFPIASSAHGALIHYCPILPLPQCGSTGNLPRKQQWFCTTSKSYFPNMLIAYDCLAFCLPLICLWKSTLRWPCLRLSFLKTSGQTRYSIFLSWPASWVWVQNKTCVHSLSAIEIHGDP